jgi:hypothetical protein
MIGNDHASGRRRCQPLAPGRSALVQNCPKCGATSGAAPALIVASPLCKRGSDYKC